MKNLYKEIDYNLLITGIIIGSIAASVAVKAEYERNTGLFAAQVKKN